MTISATSPSQSSPDWLLNQLSHRDIFFASAQHQLRSHNHAEDLHAYAPITSASVNALFAQARSRGQTTPTLFGLIPFDTQLPASLTLPLHVQHTLSPNDALTIGANSAQVSPSVLSKTPVPAPEVYGQMVERALELFAQGDVKKIVLARAMDIALDGAIDPEHIMRDLLTRNRHGYTFNLPIWAEDAQSQASMMGASPELLVRREGEMVYINPLAGSIPRHSDPVIDQQRHEGLAASEKDLREHGYVVSDIARILAEHCTELDVPETPSVIGTDALWHLSTFITARLKSPQMSALDLGLALHPTPAMCGYPTAQAFASIQALEPFAREYFAGLVGWQKENGDGEWALTIRCGRYDGQRSFRLYAGAGTVAGSDPVSEIRETETKMATFLRAITKS
ncbi:isochorismate synthase [Lampropedia puyangensis]|uniref:isochorismate synthase n=1 Tax=Lampropedia puyangensis TaxID=1330072 RepID=A0A4S8FD20_9BURK|nr:isochorismate synthase [Lampropedia puyangensis]THU05199.1 isochorismate synthase [Lampropedia puyangensis]